MGALGFARMGALGFARMGALGFARYAHTLRLPAKPQTRRRLTNARAAGDGSRRVVHTAF
jgi:hypothetical protein